MRALSRRERSSIGLRVSFTAVDDVVQLQVRTCAVRSPFPYLWNGWTDCAENWCVARDTLVWRFTKVNGGVQVRVHKDKKLLCSLQLSFFVAEIIHIETYNSLRFTGTSRQKLIHFRRVKNWQSV